MNFTDQDLKQSLGYLSDITVLKHRLMPRRVSARTSGTPA